MLRNKHEALCLKGLQAFCRKQDRRDSWQHKSIRKNVCFHCAGGEIEFCSKSVASGGAEKKWQPTPKRNTMVKAWTSSSSCNKITSSSACIWENFGFWRTPIAADWFLFSPQKIWITAQRDKYLYIFRTMLSFECQIMPLVTLNRTRGMRQYHFPPKNSGCKTGNELGEV